MVNFSTSINIWLFTISRSEFEFLIALVASKLSEDMYSSGNAMNNLCHVFFHCLICKYVILIVYLFNDYLL